MYEYTEVRQGWQCPVCKRVMSPSAMWCMFCGTEPVTAINTTGIDIRDSFHKVVKREAEMPQEVAE